MVTIKCIFAVACLFLLISTGVSVKVSVYYESLCPDSIRFITTQLYPTYKLIGDRNIDVDFVPFGFATADNSTGNWNFTCQHGDGECYGNKIQSCVIAANSVPTGVEFVNCAMGSNDPSNEENLKNCATQAQTSWENIDTCISSGQADELLVLNGQRTNSVDPPINSVPTIIFDDKFDQDQQDGATLDFLGTVCDLLDNEPQECPDQLKH